MTTSSTSFQADGYRDRLFLGMLAVTALAPLAVYWSTLTAGFVLWGDDTYLAGNPRIQDPDLSAVWWAWMEGIELGRYMPLTWMGWLFNAQLVGVGALAYHVGNVLLHMGNSALVFVAIHLVLRSMPWGSFLTTRRRTWLTLSAGSGALFWSLHPMRVEAVAWASGRPECQGLFFFLVALVCYLQHAATVEEGIEQRGYYRSALAAYAASLLSSPSLLTGFVLFILLDIFPLGRWQVRHLAPNRHAVWQEKIPFALLAVAVGWMNVWAQWRVLEAGASWPGAAPLGLLDRTMQAAYVWAYHLVKPWWPVDLSPVSMDLVSGQAMSAVFWISLGLILGASAVIWRWREHSGGLVIAWASFAALMAPALSWVTQPYFPGDRVGYAAAVLWSVVGAGLLWRGLHAPWKRTAAMGTVALMLATLGWMSHAQCGVWRTTESLLRHVIAGLGQSDYRQPIYHRLGQAYVREGAWAEAELCFREELSINPDHPEALLALGEALASRGDVADAAAFYRRLIEVQPDRKKAVLRLGKLWEAMGEGEALLRHWEAMVERWPNDTDYRLELGDAMVREGTLEEAIQVYRVAWGREPRSEAAPARLASAYLRDGKVGEAVAVLRKAVALNGESLQVLSDLAWLLSTQADPALRDPHSALVLAQRASELAGESDPRTLDILAAAYASNARFDDAQGAALRALQRVTLPSEKAAMEARLERYRRGLAIEQNAAAPLGATR